MAKKFLNYILYVENQTLRPSDAVLLSGNVYLIIRSGWVGTPQYKLYKVGDADPGYTNFADDTISVQDTQTGTVTIEPIKVLPRINKTAGTYRLYYKDTSLETLLAEFIIEDLDDSCSAFDEDAPLYSEHGDVVTVRGNDAGYALQLSFQWSDNGNSFFPRQDRTVKVSVDGGVNWKIATGGPGVGQFFSGQDTYNVTWSIAELESLGITNGIAPDVRIQRIRNGCTSNKLKNSFIYVPDSVPLSATYTKTNKTAVGNDDGTITLSVVGGSGDYSFAWMDGPVVQNRSNLPLGTYTVTITDDITGETFLLQNIVIANPNAPAPSTGGILRSPVLNSLTFVRNTIPDDCENPQAFDNVLFCQQHYEGFKKSNYLQLVNKCDDLKIQFESDFTTHTISLQEYGDVETVRTFEAVLVEQNIGKTQDFTITIRPGDLGKSKILFASGIVPIPLSVGDVFTIVNNADGFNGDYAITNIVGNTLNNQQYLVINMLYDLPFNSSAGTGRFLSNAADYNVYEADLNFVGLPDGEYYLTIVGQSDNTAILTSEPIKLADEHPGSVEVIYRNNDDGYGDITWSTGITCKVRLPGYVGHQRLPGGERSTSRNSDYSITKVNAKKTRGFMLQVLMLPPYMHEKCSVIFDCDYYAVNRVECQSTDAYADPKYIDAFLLANSEIKIQQKGWFKKYNSNDLGSVNEGFILTETGFIKR